MYIQELQAFNFKNYEFLSVQFRPRINILIGNNGQGKTNVLDMLYYLSLCKSPTHHPDSASIRHETPYATLRGVYSDNNAQTFHVALALKRNAPKELLFNETAYSRLGEHIGKIPLVAIYPQDIELTCDGGDLKRRFLNATIAQYEKEYLTAIQHYELALAQRNALLKTRGHLDLQLLEMLEQRLVSSAAIIFRERKLLCERIAPQFEYFYNLIAPNHEQPNLVYRSQLSEGDFLELLQKARPTDTHLGHTTIGIHRDNIDFYLAGYPLRREGSQGQQKTFVVALRLAQFAYIAEITKQTPILLLDDIFDRFDAQRVENLLQLFSSDTFGQVFITDTSPAPQLAQMGIYRNATSIYRVEDQNLTLVGDV